MHISQVFANYLFHTIFDLHSKTMLNSRESQSQWQKIKQTFQLSPTLFPVLATTDYTITSAWPQTCRDQFNVHFQANLTCDWCNFFTRPDAIPNQNQSNHALGIILFSFTIWLWTEGTSPRQYLTLMKVHTTSVVTVPKLSFAVGFGRFLKKPRWRFRIQFQFFDKSVANWKSTVGWFNVHTSNGWQLHKSNRPQKQQTTIWTNK